MYIGMFTFAEMFGQNLKNIIFYFQATALRYFPRHKLKNFLLINIPHVREMSHQLIFAGNYNYYVHELF